MTDLEALRRVRGADVYKAGCLAASITRTKEGGTEFAYLPGYSGDPVASTLPVDAVPVISASGSVPAFFAGLLPEGHRLTVLRRAVKTSVDDELSLLLAVGADAPGDVQVYPAGAEPTDVPALVDCESAEELDFLHLVEDVDLQAIPGVQNKASASMISTPIAAGFGRFILKLSQPSYPYLIENEAAHLSAARVMKLLVSEADLVYDKGGLPGLLVRRFDRVFESGSWQRLAFEDATQILGLPPSAKYGIDAVDAVAALAGVVGAPLVAVRNLYLQFVFAWLTGNGDLHGKNVGALRDSAGRWAVAPIYDIPCTLVYGDDSMALPIAGRTKNLRANHWMDFAGEIGLPRKAAVSAQRLALRAAAAVDFERIPIIGSPRNHTMRELRLRRGELAKLAG
ncbi:type II toxin-antitoxin system HipA family toxin [Nocardia neocaledoniensis]|uniref:type II toxin-antitoxin system HipA family toxin n=1 Tax=Nocardia neocaledoniensis TaxID=236511 RepID=UPI002454B6B1|nr:HipA domain-containing protein [Nocardia neocaledoniensis]